MTSSRLEFTDSRRPSPLSCDNLPRGDVQRLLRSRERCLVTGGSGFLGRYLVRNLAERSNVTVLGRKALGGTGSLRIDLTQPGFDLGCAPFDRVYHLAGLAHVVPRRREERDRFFMVNYKGTTNLLMALDRAPRLPRSFVLASTVAVYGVEEGTLLDESTPRSACDPYGASKRAAEDAVMEWGERRGVCVALVRLPLVAGRGAPGNLGMMVRSLSRGTYWGVGAGCARRSMVLADDVCRALPRIAQVGGVFHLADGHHPSFAELEQALSSALGKPPPRRLPMHLAKMGGRIGELMHSLTGVRMPLTTKNLNKMVSTLTFSDQRARESVGWNPDAVVSHAAELVSTTLPIA